MVNCTPIIERDITPSESHATRTAAASRESNRAEGAGQVALKGLILSSVGRKARKFSRKELLDFKRLRSSKTGPPEKAAPKLLRSSSRCGHQPSRSRLTFMTLPSKCQPKTMYSWPFVIIMPYESGKSISISWTILWVLRRIHHWGSHSRHRVYWHRS